MGLTDKIKELYEEYLTPIVAGAMFPYAAATSTRIMNAQGKRAKNRGDFLGKGQFYMQELGTISSLIFTSGALIYGMDRLLRYERDPNVFLATLGALLLGNVGSILYEDLREAKRKKKEANTPFSYWEWLVDDT